jgi:hypothetical protein
MNIYTHPQPKYKPEPPKRGKVVPLLRPMNNAAAFQQLTARLVLDQHRRGVLPAAVIEYLMAGVGLHP